MVTADFNHILHCFLFTWTVGVLVMQKADAQHGSTVDEQTIDSSYFFYRQAEYPRDCKEVQDQCASSNSSGVYYIKPDGYPEAFQVYCDTAEDSTGWTIIQRRSINGIIGFSRNWDDYKKGFGFLSYDYWIGNERLSYLTNQEDYKISIEMTLSNGSIVTALYSNFRIGDESSDYRLFNVTQYDGTTDAITWISCTPKNMVHDLCTCGQRSCEEPAICKNTCEAAQTIGCICPAGYYMNGEDCVPAEDCGCYLAEEDMVIPEGVTYVDDMCTRVAVCSGGRLTRDEPYKCRSNAECDERDGVRKCYCNEGYNGDGETCYRTDCMDLYNAGSTSSGVYRIQPDNWPGPAFDVYCNMTNGGGWTVLQRRIDGSIDFFLTWHNYSEGFGDKNLEFWLGNDKLHYLTYQKRYKVRIDLVNRDHDQYYAEFDYFRVDNEDAQYRLSGLGTYSGNADERSNADGYYILGHGRDRGFSTKNRDNDASSSDLAASYYGAWWYGTYGYLNINGRYSDYFRINYLPGTGALYFSEMKIRPV